jgi:hypothetical protein
MPTADSNTHVRCQLIETDDSQDQQMCQHYGRYNERYGSKKYGVPKQQNYGRTSHDPKEAHGRLTSSNGNPVMAMSAFHEDPKSRPKNLEEGQWKDYDKWSHYCHAKQDQWYWKVGTAVAWYKDAGEIHLNPPSSELIANSMVLLDGETHPLTDPRVGYHKHHFTQAQCEALLAEEWAAEERRKRIIEEAQFAFAIQEQTKENRLLAMEARIAELEARLNAIDSEAT